jgi:hypothetical protein
MFFFVLSIKTQAMENLPFYIELLFLLAFAATIFFFYRAANRSRIVLIILAGWIIVQGVIATTGFYTSNNTIPPRLALAVLPPFAAIAYLMISRHGRRFVDSLDARTLTLLHIVRIPVEFVLLFLFLHKAIPASMTFEGMNFDILSGLTAPLIYYFGYVQGKLRKGLLLAWNLLCLALLVNVVTIAILSIPTPFQTLSFDQPNIAVLYMPFVWLPAVVVPIVFFSHLVCIRQLLAQRSARVKLAI